MDTDKKVLTKVIKKVKMIKQGNASKLQNRPNGKINLRKVARFVAFWQLIIATVCLFIVIGSILISTMFTVEAMVNPESISEAFYKMPKHRQEMAVGFLWAAVVALLVENIFQFLSSVRLLQATEVGTPVNKALECTRYWRNVTVVFTILDTMALSVGYKTGFLAILFLVTRIMYVWIIAEFLTELEKRKLALIAAEKKAKTSDPFHVQIAIPH